VGHDGLDEGFCARDAAGDGLEIEAGLRGIAVGDAVDAVLSGEDEGVGEQVEGDGEAAAVRAHHEFVVVEFGAFFVEDVHVCAPWDAGWGRTGWRFQDNGYGCFGMGLRKERG